MPTSKRHTIKGTTRKVAPPPAAPDVTKKGRKPPRIREDPSKVGRRKLAPLPDTTIDLTHSKEMSSLCSSSNQASTAASTLRSLVTLHCSVAAAASTILYHQLYSAGGNNHKEEQLYSDDNKDDNDED